MLSAAQLEEYTGDYYSEELDMVYRIESVDGKLYMRFRNAPEDPLEAVTPDVFTLSSISATFSRDEGGTVSGFEVSAGRVKGIRFDKKYSSEVDSA